MLRYVMLMYSGAELTIKTQGNSVTKKADESIKRLAQHSRVNVNVNVNVNAMMPLSMPILMLTSLCLLVLLFC